MNAVKVMKARKMLAAGFRDEKAIAVAQGDFVKLRSLMELTDDIESGRHDVSDEIYSLSDDELLAQLSA